MLNQSPIFLNCFSRGGSNIFWNMFLTHPDACSPIIETLSIFRLDWRAPTWAGLKAAWYSRQLRLFNQWYLQPRSPVSGRTQAFMDKVLYQWKLKTVHDIDMKYKYEDETYDLDEVKRARLVAKNNNGLAFLSDIFCHMYSDATFFALVRDPIALYEGHRRHGITEHVERFASFYERIAARMIADEARIARYHIIRFEDLLIDPIGMMQQVYALADLDFNKVKKVRFKAKPHFQANGQRRTAYTAGRHYWFEPEEVYKMIDPDINTYQADRLSSTEQERLLHLTANSRKHFGYEKQ
jgi:hypothetical protein